MLCRHKYLQRVAYVAVLSLLPIIVYNSSFLKKAGNYEGERAPLSGKNQENEPYLYIPNSHEQQNHAEQLRNFNSSLMSSQYQAKPNDEAAVEIKHIPKVLIGLINDTKELKGRHSDYIIDQPCQKATHLSSNGIENQYGFLGPFEYLKHYKNPCWRSKDSKKINCVPYVYIIGIYKAATSDLFYRLTKHPHVWPGARKELHFFNTKRFRGTTFQDYVDTFRNSIDQLQKTDVTNKTGKEYHSKVLLDATPGYFRGTPYWRNITDNKGCEVPRVDVMSHIHHLWPNAKIILTLRDPVTRLFSHYLQNCAIAGTRASPEQFDSLVRDTLDYSSQCLEELTFRQCTNWVDRPRFGQSKVPVMMGVYSRFFLDLLKLFPRDQIYVLHYETYVKNTKKYLKEIFEFLELPPLSEPELNDICQLEKRNPGTSYKAVPEMWSSTQKLLKSFYAPFNLELSAIFDEDPKWLWLS